jgi:hypothetical protein
MPHLGAPTMCQRWGTPLPRRQRRLTAAGWGTLLTRPEPSSSQRSRSCQLLQGTMPRSWRAHHADGRKKPAYRVAAERVVRAGVGSAAYAPHVLHQCPRRMRHTGRNDAADAASDPRQAMFTFTYVAEQHNLQIVPVLNDNVYDSCAVGAAVAAAAAIAVCCGPGGVLAVTRGDVAGPHAQGQPLVGGGSAARSMLDKQHARSNLHQTWGCRDDAWSLPHVQPPAQAATAALVSARCTSVAVHVARTQRTTAQQQQQHGFSMRWQSCTQAGVSNRRRPVPSCDCARCCCVARRAPRPLEARCSSGEMSGRHATSSASPHPASNNPAWWQPRFT